MGWRCGPALPVAVIRRMHNRLKGNADGVLAAARRRSLPPGYCVDRGCYRGEPRQGRRRR